MKRERILEQKLRNLIHTAALFAGMLGLLALLGWVVAGPSGLAGLVAAGLVLLTAGMRVSPALILRLYGARPLAVEEAPGLYGILAELSRRAGLERAPRLFYIPTPMINAFTVGSREEAAVTVTAGLLENLNRRELVGVLAHEIAHVRHNDLRVLGLADLVSRATVFFSWMGQFLLLVNLPLWMAAGYSVPWLAVLLLIFAPTLTALLQLALSRSREFDADLGAVELTGDPRGLASALYKLETYRVNFLERIFLPGRRLPEPSLLRTHPATEERIRRLLELEGEAPRYEPALWEEEFPVRPSVRISLRPGPMWRWTGLWH